MNQSERKYACGKLKTLADASCAYVLPKPFKSDFGKTIPNLTAVVLRPDLKFDAYVSSSRVGNTMFSALFVKVADLSAYRKRSAEITAFKSDAQVELRETHKAMVQAALDTATDSIMLGEDGMKAILDFKNAIK